MAYYLRRAPSRLLKMAPLGWRMFRAGRFPWRTEKIEDVKGLRRIIAKAEEMEQVHPRETLESVRDVGYGAVTERVVAASGGEQ